MPWHGVTKILEAELEKLVINTGGARRSDRGGLAGQSESGRDPHLLVPCMVAGPPHNPRGIRSRLRPLPNRAGLFFLFFNPGGLDLIFHPVVRQDGVHLCVPDTDTLHHNRLQRSKQLPPATINTKWCGLAPFVGQRESERRLDTDNPW